MKFCRECGSQIDDADKFCGKCGAPTGVAPTPTGSPQPSYQQMPQQNSVYSTLGVPQPGPNEAILLVTCNSVNPRGCVAFRTNSGQNYRIDNNGRSAIKMPVGNMVLNYTIDRGPGLTLVAARSKKYSKMLTFHPGEVIIMQVRIGNEVNQALFQSSMGFAII